MVDNDHSASALGYCDPVCMDVCKVYHQTAFSKNIRTVMLIKISFVSVNAKNLGGGHKINARVSVCLLFLAN